MRERLSAFKADFFKALAHPLRISILDALRDGEMTVNEISQRFGIEAAHASQQLAVLAREAGTALIEPDGRRVRLTRQAGDHNLAPTALPDTTEVTRLSRDLHYGA